MAEDCCGQFKESFNKIFYEFLGTMLLASLWNSCFFMVDVVGFFTGFYILYTFCSKKIGGHFNPAITLAYMFRKDVDEKSKRIGLLYILFQYIGALLGTIISYNILAANGKYRTPCSVLKGGDKMDSPLFI